MAAVGWQDRLQSLPFSSQEKGEIVRRLYSEKWAIQQFFDDCQKCGGEAGLITALRGLLQGADVRIKKNVEVYVPELQNDEIVAVKGMYMLTQATFDRFLPAGTFLVPLKGGQPDADAKRVLDFGDLEEGLSYVLKDTAGLPLRIKALENFNASEMRACEDELAGSMVRELKVHGLAENPLSRPDLRLHCRGSAQEQEFDAVVLDGDHKLFVGSAKHVAHGTSEVEDMLQNVRILADRAKNVEHFPSYAPFQGRAVGCCIRLDTIKETRRQDVVHLCSKKGVGLFQRSGAALTMQHLPVAGPLSLEPGYIHVAVRGLKRLAR